MTSKTDLHSVLRGEIVGSFDMHSTAHIACGPYDQRSAAFVHEESHRKATSSTTFGAFQKLLAHLAKQAGSIGDVSEQEKFIGLLDSTIGKSFYCHEGYATWRQTYLAPVYGYCPGQPHPEYAKAASYFEFSKSAIPSDFQWLRIGVARALCEAALNSTILSQIDLTRIGESLSEHFSRRFNRPDERLKYVSQAFSERARELLSQEEILDLAAMIPQQGSENQWLRALLYQENITSIGVDPALLEQWDIKETDALHGLLSRLDLPFKVMNPRFAYQEIKKFVNEDCQHLNALGYSIPKAKRGTYYESAIQAENTQYEPRESRFTTVIVGNRKIHAFLRDLTQGIDTKLVLILEWLSNPNSYRHKFGGLDFSVCATPYRQIENSAGKPNSIEIKPYRFRFFGPREEVTNTLSTVTDKIALVAVDWVRVFDKELNVAVPDHVALLLSDLGLKLMPIAVVEMTTSDFFLRFLEGILSRKSARIAALSGGSEFTYFLALPERGPGVYFKCSPRLLNILKESNHKCWEQLKRSLVCPEKVADIWTQISTDLHPKTVEELFESGLFAYYH